MDINKKSNRKEDYKLSACQKFYRFIKSIADFLMALIALIVLCPLFIIVAIAIKVDSKGPVFFLQNRIGKNGKEFKCIKFRSMAQDAKHDVASHEFSAVDSYITKVGKVIRKLSIDELPQIFNILAFQMSWIGFRPALSNQTDLDEMRKQYNVYQVKPGISGWAQVNGRDVLAASSKKKAEYDRYYVKHFSIWLDIKIFFMTIGKVFSSADFQEGAVDKNDTEEAVALDKSNVDGGLKNSEKQVG